MQNIEELIERDILRLEYLNLESNINKLVDLDTEIHRYLNIFNDKELEKLELNREDLIEASKRVIQHLLEMFKELFSNVVRRNIEGKFNNLADTLRNLEKQDTFLKPDYRKDEEIKKDLAIQAIIKNDNAFYKSLENLNQLAELIGMLHNKYYYTKETHDMIIDLTNGNSTIFSKIDITPFEIDEKKIIKTLSDSFKSPFSYPLQKLIFVLPSVHEKHCLYVGGYGVNNNYKSPQCLLAAKLVQADFIKELPKEFASAEEIFELTKVFLGKQYSLLKICTQYKLALRKIIQYFESKLRSGDDVFTKKEINQLYERIEIRNGLGSYLNPNNVIESYIDYFNRQLYHIGTK